MVANDEALAGSTGDTLPVVSLSAALRIRQAVGRQLATATVSVFVSVMATVAAAASVHLHLHL